MLTAQVILHIAENATLLVHHIVEAPVRGCSSREEARRAGSRVRRADHNAMCFALEEYHRHTQGCSACRRRNSGHRDLHAAGRAARGVLAALDPGARREHEIHHRAQLNMYLRMLGIAPPKV
jgi:hypothetical protein